MLAVDGRSAARRGRAGDERRLHALELLVRDRSSVVERGEAFELTDGINRRSGGPYSWRMRGRQPRA
jgi:hypothetical protein